MKWQIGSENEKKTTLEEAKFIFSQAEKALRETINGSNLIVTRTTILLSIVVGLLSALIGYSINKWNSNKIDDIFITSSLLSCYLFWLTTYLIKNIKGQDYMSMGSEPDKLLHDYYFQKFPENKEREIQNYISEIKNYQERIENNKSINNLRWKIFHNSIKYIVYYLPAISVFLYTLIHFTFLLFYHHLPHEFGCTCH